MLFKLIFEDEAATATSFDLKWQSSAIVADPILLRILPSG
jgi:hypothetical protein